MVPKNQSELLSERNKPESITNMYMPTFINECFIENGEFKTYPSERSGIILRRVSKAIEKSKLGRYHLHPNGRP